MSSLRYVNFILTANLGSIICLVALYFSSCGLDEVVSGLKPKVKTLVRFFSCKLNEVVLGQEPTGILR